MAITMMGHRVLEVIVVVAVDDAAGASISGGCVRVVTLLAALDGSVAADA
jgi:hypothetical protein